MRKWPCLFTSVKVACQWQSDFSFRGGHARNRTPFVSGILLCAFLASITTHAEAGGINLITEGDFESSPTSPLGTPFGGWTYEDFAGVLMLTDGNIQAVRLESNGTAVSDPTATQTVSGLTVGAAYTLEWDWRLRINFSGFDKGWSFGVFLDTQSSVSALFLSKTLSQTFLHSSVEFTASDTTHTFIFAGELDARSNGAVVTQSNDGRTDVSYYLDNVSLTVVPEPTGFGMAVLALSGFCFRPRRRRS